MSKVKNEHFVPQVYLNNFAGKGAQLYAYDKTITKSFKTHVKNVACKKAFYDFPSDESQPVENALKEIEGDFTNVLKALLDIAHSKQPIPKEFKAVFAPYIVMQILRTPDFRLGYRETMEKAMQKLLPVMMKSENISINFSDLDIRLNPDVEPALHAEFMFNQKTIQEYSAAICNHVWKIGYSVQKHPLYTSDNPVVIIPHKKADWQSSYTGLASEGVEIAYPLDPYHILLMSHISHYKNSLQIANIFDGRPVSLSRDNITFYNSKQVFSSTRQIYSISDDFKLAEEICKKNPEYNDPSRPRIVMG